MTRRAWQIVGVGIVAVVAIVLSAFALARARPVSPTAHASTVHTTLTATPTPSTSARGATPAVTPASAQRFLSADGDTVWRATAGDCHGTRPVIDYSADGGKTWTNVTPRDGSVRQIGALDAIAPAASAMVAGTGTSCTAIALRTFTGGVAWAPDSATLAIEHYVSLIDAARVVIPGATVAAPCLSPEGLRATSAMMAVICGGTAYVHITTRWNALPIAHAVAVAPVHNGVLVASADSAGCTGIALTRFTVGGSAGTPGMAAGCAVGVTTAGPIAISPTGTGTLVWAGSTIVNTPSA